MNKKYVHCYINEKAKISGANNIQIDQMNHVPNGSCDILSFNEANSIHKTQLAPVLSGLSRKIKIGVGLMCLEYINFDKVCNDIRYNKISIEQINDILSDKLGFFLEKDIEEILQQFQLTTKQVMYDGYRTKLTIQRVQ
jgi:hypothetical protein